MAETDSRLRKKSSSNQNDSEHKSQAHLLKEIIEIKPRIDLIPDEFLRDANNNILVELVYGERDEGAEEFSECLEHLGYFVTKTDKDREGMAEQINEEWIQNVIQKISKTAFDGLIMIFAKVVYNNAMITALWSKFTAQMCPNLKNKPKIFIFQIPRGVSVDNTATSLGWMSAYETPAEADILIIHDMDYDQKDDLLKQLVTGIEDHGRKEDIFTLASLSYQHDYQPLIISTMTRKFYFTLGEHRGHHFSLQRNYENIKQQLDKINNKLEEKSTEKKPKKKGSSFTQALKKTFSFRNGKKNSLHEDNNRAAEIAEERADELKKTMIPEKVQNDKLKIEVKKVPLTVKSPMRSPTAPPPSSGAIRKISTSTRIKTTSVSSEGKGDASVKKPAWKP